MSPTGDPPYFDYHLPPPKEQLSFPITNVEWEIRYNEEVERRKAAEKALDDIQEAIDRLLCKYYGHADTASYGKCIRCWEKV